MKKIFFLLSLVLCSIQVFPAKSDTSPVTIKNTSIKKVGNNVTVTFDIALRNFSPNHKVTITPVLYNNQNRSQTLPPTVIVGRKRNISDQRSGNTSGSHHKVGRNSPRIIPYAATVPFEAWMQEVSVSALQLSDGCGCENDYPSETIALHKLLYYDIVPRFNASKLNYEFTELEKYDLDNPFLHAMEDYPNRHHVLLMDREKNTSRVVFKVGSSVIDPEHSGNREALLAIIRAFDVIRNDSNAILKHIMVAGYASPEGSLALNTRLGQARAESVKRYIMKEVSEPIGHLFELHNGREDWGRLREMVLKSDMDEKAEVVDIIDYYTMEQEVRKTRLKQLNGGASYKYMLENLYPTLRTGGYIQVYYAISRRGAFTIPVTDARDRTVWIDSDSPRNKCITAVNKATDYMVDQHFDEALNTLIGFKDDPRTWNHIGVCCMMGHNYDEAEVYFRKAVERGDSDALENLEQIRHAREVEK